MTKHTIVFLAANPSGTDPRALDREARAIHLELRRSGYRDRFELVTRWAAEPLDLLRELRALKPTVVHFSGHGGPSGLWFHTAAGGARPVPTTALVKAFDAAGASVRLVVLSACYSEAQADALLAHVDHVVGVVGIGGAIHDDAARIFAIGFYGGLGEYEPIDIAFKQGLAAITLEGLPDGDRPRLKIRAGIDAGQLTLTGVAPEAPAAPPPCPYPGMRPYSADIAAHFHGRGAEVGALLGRLRAGARELYVIGPSGSGKSSLVAAGLLPRLRTSQLGPFFVRSMRPGEQPTARLLEALEAQGEREPAAAVAALLENRAADAFLLLVIDQLEELFTLADAGERASFLDALRVLREEHRCVLLFVLRADFYGALMDSPLWAKRHGGLVRVDVTPLRGPALREAIERPARDLRVSIEHALVERLLADAAAEPGILPLLQETLSQLWDRQRQRRLTLADYEVLGEGGRSGLAVALSHRADATLRGLTAPQQAIARRILLRLVSFGEGRSDTRRQQPRSALATSDLSGDFDEVLRRLVEDRLLTVDDDDRVDLAHEVMLTAWPALAGWIQTRRADEQRRRQLEAAAARWVERGRGGRGLFDPIDLAEAEAWQATESARELGQSDDLLDLIAASRTAQESLAAAKRAAQERRQQRRRVAFAALASISVVIAGLAYTAHREAREAEASRNRAEVDRRRAEASDRESQRLLARSYLEAGWQQLLEGHPQEALPYLMAARERGEGGELLRFLIGTATRSLPAIPILEHRAAVSSAAFSLDSTRVVTASSDHTASIWDAATGKPLAAALEHRAPVSNAAFSPDGARVATASEDHTARIWDAATGKLLAALEHRQAVWRAAFSPDGARVATASEDHTARIWDGATGKLLATLKHEDVVWSVAFSPDGARVVTASFDNTARVWDAATGQPLGAPLRHQGRVNGAAFSPDGARVVTTSFDKTARLWDATTGKPAAPPLQHESIVRSAAFSPDGARVVTASSDHTARIWDAATGRPLASLAHPAAVRGAAFSPDGARVVTASFDHTARLWDAATGELLGSPLEHQGGVNGAAFSPDGARVVTASLDGTARVWDAAAGKPASLLAPPGGVNRTAFSPDGTRAVTASDHDNTARIWDVATGKPLAPPLEHQGWVWSAAFSPDGARVVTASLDSTARVWDAATGRPLTPPLEHRAWVWSAAFSPDGTRVVTASLDSTARVWDAATGEPLAIIEHQGSVNRAAFSPGGTCVVTASDDRTARIWDAATGKPVAPPFLHPAAVTSAAFSPDGTRIITASDDRSTRVWETRLDETASPEWPTLSARSPFVLSGAVHARRPSGRALELAPRAAPPAIARPAPTPGASRLPVSPDEAIATSIPQPPTRRAEATPFAPGQIWSGHYYCAQGKTSLGLQITSVRGNLVEAVFTFSHAESGASGSHHVAGRYDPARRRLDLPPGAWIRRPPGYVMVGLSGTVSADGSTFAGTLPDEGPNGCSCGVARSSAVSSTSASAIPDGACSTFTTRRR